MVFKQKKNTDWQNGVYFLSITFNKYPVGQMFNKYPVG